MNDEHKQHLLDDLDKMALKLLMDENAAIEGDALWRAYQQAEQSGSLPEIPEELDEQCRALIRDSVRKQNRERILTRTVCSLQRVAVVALVLLALTSTLVLSVDAIKIPVMNFFVTNQGRSSSLKFHEEPVEEETKELVDQVISIRPPAGYQLVNQESDINESFSLRYENSDSDQLLVSIMASDKMLNIDMEDVEQVSMKIYDCDAIYIQKRVRRILWLDQERELVFDVRADELEESLFWKYVYRLAELSSGKE